MSPIKLVIKINTYELTLIIEFIPTNVRFNNTITILKRMYLRMYFQLTTSFLPSFYTDLGVSVK